MHASRYHIKKKKIAKVLRKQMGCEEKCTNKINRDGEGGRKKKEKVKKNLVANSTKRNAAFRSKSGTVRHQNLRRVLHTSLSPKN